MTFRMLNELVNDFRLKDAAVVVEGEQTVHTYFSDKGTTSSQIDFLFVSEFVKVKGYETAPVLFSDHKLLCCSLELGVGVNFGNGLWKLNVAILEGEGVCERVCTYLEKLVEQKEDFVNVLGWWDWAKDCLAKFLQNMCRVKAKEKKEKELALKRKLHFLYKCKKIGVEVAEELKEVREQRDKMLKDKGKRIIFNAKIKDMEEGEKCTRYFFKKAFAGKKGMATVLVGEE